MAVGEENAAAGDEDDVGETDSALDVGAGGSLGILSPLDGEDEAAAAAMAAAMSDWESIPAAAGGTQEAAVFMAADDKKYCKRRWYGLLG